MMFGSRVRFGITYKTNQPGFQIYTRKFFHNFKVALSSQNYEGAIGENLTSLEQYIMSEKQKIGIYDAKTFKLVQDWQIPGTDPNVEILYLTVSKDDKKIGVALGKHVIKDQFKLQEIAIYIRRKNGNWELEKLCDFDFPEACKTFYFNHHNSEELLFFS